MFNDLKTLYTPFFWIPLILIAFAVGIKTGEPVETDHFGSKLITIESRIPVILYSKTVEQIHAGPLVDSVVDEVSIGFDPKIHKGYLVPIKHKNSVCVSCMTEGQGVQ